MISLATRIGRRSDRGLARHFAYAVEAAVLANWTQHADVQHVHAHFGTNAAAIAMLASQISGIPYSFTAHGSEEFEKAPLLSLDKKLERSAFAVCVSSYGKSQLMRWTSPNLWPKIHLVHCGLESAYFEQLRQKIVSAPRFVCVGRIGEHKAQLVLVGAVRRLRDAGIYCEVVLAGDGPMRPYVEAEILRASLVQRICITGWISGERVKTEILRSRALILPSFSENMPIVIMEAMALGRPVISTYVAGIPELVKPGTSGWLVPPGDEMALAEVMHEALRASVDELGTMGEMGRAHIAEHHVALNEAKKLKNLFETNVPHPSSIL